MTRLGRELACIRCDAIWDVIEPIEHIDPRRYVCPDCLQPIDGQLEIAGPRVDEREYDPDLARIPY